MTIKEFVLSRFQLFFFLTTMILAAEYIIGVVAAPDQVLHNKDLLAPIAAAGLCIVPTCVTYFKNEPTLKQYLVRLMIQLVLIEIVMLTAVNPEGFMEGDEVKFYVVISVTVLVIYIFAVMVMYYMNYLQAKSLTSELVKFRQREAVSE
ncbi:MAG: hypothetical protein IIZ59_03655 [Clostridia bacterium]|nr:hypothetical protein [Clostridia bacterium]